MTKRVYFLILISTVFMQIAPLTFASSIEVNVKEESRPWLQDTKELENITQKFEPWLWEKVQKLETNETTRNTTIPIMVRLFKNSTIDQLKHDVASLLVENHGADVYCVPNGSPIVMVKVPVFEVEKIAMYDFVEKLGDSHRELHLNLDISRQAIRVTDVENVYGPDGSGIKIAIIDSGINSSHPDLDDLDDVPTTSDPKVIEEISFIDWDDNGVPDPGEPGEPMDYCGHGTHMAGIIAGTGAKSNYQYVGIAPGACLMNLKASSYRAETGEFQGQADDAINAIYYAVSHGANVINLALGAPAKERGCEGDCILCQAADDAVSNGVVVVAGVGNHRDGEVLNPQPPDCPGNAFNVITVGASEDHDTVNIDDDTLWDRSRTGPTLGGPDEARKKPDVIAPGVDIIAPISRASAIWQTYPEFRVGDFYAKLDGTSMATAHVSGLAALILQEHPGWTPGSVKAAIMSHARLNTNLEGLSENYRGKGIIDAYNSVHERVTNLGFESDSTGWSGWTYYWKGPDPPTWEAKYHHDKAHGAIYSGQLWGWCKASYTGWVWAKRYQTLSPGIRGGGTFPIYFKGFVKFMTWGFNVYPVARCDAAYTAIEIEFLKDDGTQKWIYYVFMPWGTGTDHAGDPNRFDYIIGTTFQLDQWYDCDGVRNLNSDFQGAFGIQLDNTWRVSRIGLIIAMKNPWTSQPDKEGPWIHVWFDDISLWSPRHDVAVVSVTPVLPWGAQATYPGWNIDIHVTVKNEGGYTETFGVTAYYDSIAIDTKTVTNLASGAEKTITFTWNTPNIPKIYPYPEYVVSTTAGPVLGETDTGDNTLTDGTVMVKWPGDAGPPWYGDGHVDILDQILLTNSWYRRYGQAGYNPQCDFNGDGSVDIFDLFILVDNWYKGPLD